MANYFYKGEEVRSRSDRDRDVKLSWAHIDGNRAVRRCSNSPAPPKRLLNVIGEPPIQYNKVHRRNTYNKYNKVNLIDVFRS